MQVRSYQAALASGNGQVAQQKPSRYWHEESKAAKEGYHFSVGNVGAGGKLYLR